MKAIIFIFSAILLLLSCNSDEEIVKKKELPKDDLEIISSDFEGTEFKDPIHLELLKELDICDMVLDENTGFATCSPENFQIIPFNKNKSVRDAFILHVKSATRLKGQDVLLPVRHVIVFEIEQGKLVRTNGFRGEFFGMRKGQNNIKDIILALYLKEDETLFHCRFKWNDGKFSFNTIEGLDYGEGMRSLKKESKDSISAQVYSALVDANVIF